MSIDDDQPRALQLEGLLEQVIRMFLDQVRTGLPGRIVSYDATAQKASVQILVQFGEIVAGDRVVQPIAPLADVPVIFIGGNGGKTRRTYPVVAGDLCWLMFSSSSMALFKAQGAPNGPVDPGDDTRHRLSDAVCIVGGHTFNDVPTDAPLDAVVENLANGVIMKIGSSSAAQPPALNADLLYLCQQIVSALDFAALQATISAFMVAHPGWPAGSTTLLLDS